MKKIKLLSFLLLTNLSFVNAQNNVWPTENAEWYYTYCDMLGCNKYTHYKIERDTVINSSTYQIYSREEVSPNSSSSTTDINYIEKFLFVSVLDSTVVYFDPISEETDTIIDFKANVGDTWRNYNRDNKFCFESGEFLLTEVLGKTMEMVNGENLLKFTLQRTPPAPFMNSYTEIFYQKMGGNLLFLPNRICNILDYPYESELRCFYQDTGMANAFSYQSSNDPCDKLSLLEIDEYTQSNLKIYPNPTSDLLNIISDHDEDIQFTDLNGRILLEAKLKPKIVNTFNIQDFESGIYYILCANKLYKVFKQ